MRRRLGRQEYKARKLDGPGTISKDPAPSYLVRSVAVSSLNSSRNKVLLLREEYVRLLPLLFVCVCVFYVASSFPRSGLEQLSVQINLR